jgi:hypothetical protein
MRYAFSLLKLFITASIIFFLAQRIHLAEIYRLGRSGNFSFFAAAMLLFFVQSCVSMLRWHVILRRLGAQQSLGQTTRIFWTSLLFSTFLPAGLVSDTVRIWIMRQAGADLPHSIDSVLLDRMVGLIGMIAVAAAALPFARAIIPLHLALYSVPLLVAATVAGVIGGSLLDRLPARWPLSRPLGRFAHDLRMFLLSPEVVGLAGAATLFCAASQPVIVYLIGRGLGIELSILDCLVLVPLIVLFLTLPISIAGWGVREGAMVALFGAVGVPATAALALSILYGVAGIIVTLPGLIFLIAWRGTPAPMLEPLGELE